MLTRYAACARKEIFTALQYFTWTPIYSPDLCLGFISSAVALGYDWLYDYLSEQDRITIRMAIKTKALEPARLAYEGAPGHDMFGFRLIVKYGNNGGNHNLVSNSGIVLSALAIAEYDNAYTTMILNYAVTSMSNNGLQMLHTDGGWEEGVGYQGFALDAFVNTLSALDTALATDLGLKTVTPGFAKAGDFRIHMEGPPTTAEGPASSGLEFNFADMRSDGWIFHNTYTLWFANKYSQPLLARAERRISAWKQPLAFHLLWYSDDNPDPDGLEPLNKLFPDVGVASMRTSWKVCK